MDKIVNLSEIRQIKALEEENAYLRELLETSLGHHKTSVSFQESVLVDRFLPEGSAVTFRLGDKPTQGPDKRIRVVCQTFEGKLELTVLGGDINVQKTGKNRVDVVAKKLQPFN